MKTRLFTALLLVVVVVVVAVLAERHHNDGGGGGGGHRVEVTPAKSGPLIGETITAENRSIARFLGVPYGKVPRRFRRAVSVERWRTAREALHWPPSCWQKLDHPFNAITRSQITTDQSVAEDCLHLNIWTPANLRRDSGAEEAPGLSLRPVIVWFHAGSLLVGSSALRWYEGETLAARADAVVVTVNYRLSAHGFLYSDQLDDVKGNQGLWDQRLALVWVQENIRSFGGDPASVTIMGVSAGGWSTSTHVLSPASRQLFHRAVLMSGATVNRHVAVQPAVAVARWLRAIRRVGCAAETDRTISKAVVDCLEQLPAEKVDAVGYLVSEGHGELPLWLPTLVTVDGQFLPDHPIALLRSGNYKKDVQLLVDTVTDEGSFMFTGEPRFHRTQPQPINLTAATEFFFAALDDNFDGAAASYPKEVIRKLYFEKLNGHHHHEEDAEDVYRRAVAVAFGDFLIGCPTLHFAREVFTNAPATATVYQWHLTSKLGAEKAFDVKWGDGPAHGDDIFPVFGVPFRSPRLFTDRERDISREVIRFLAAFIRTGTVGEQHRQWQSYFLAADGHTVIAPYYQIASQHRTVDSFGFNLKEAECEYVWNRLN